MTLLRPTPYAYPFSTSDNGRLFTARQNLPRLFPPYLPRSPSQPPLKGT